MASPFDDPLRPRVIRIRLGLIWLMLLLVAVVCGGAYWYLRHGGFTPAREWIERDLAPWPSWLRQKVSYTAPEPEAVNHVSVPVRDLNAEAIAALRAELLQQRQLLEALKNRPVVTTTPAPAKPITPPSVKRPPLMFVSHERKNRDDAPESPLKLTPGTWIPCTVDTTLNSEIEGYFTVKTRRPVSDSVTGQHVVIPAGQSIVAKDTTSALLLGNERIPTFALTLSLPDGQSLDLGDAPIMDATGTNGLTGDVNNHIWRLVWTSIFIGGLRGGQQMVQAELTQSGGAGLIVSGIAGQGSSVAQQRLGRAQDTRPIITVQPGELCNVLVTKSLSLSPMTAKR
jgi:type IV secretory pathway VirB10-like protein